MSRSTNTTKFAINGLSETLEVFRLLEEEIGDKKARSKVLIPAAKEAMKTVLTAAKKDAPYDDSPDHTGLHLKNSLSIFARRPTRNDKRSLYVSKTDSVIAMVTTKPIPKKLKKQTVGMKRKEAKKFYASKGIIYDGRAIANEFGTAKMAAQPFMRPALESNAGIVISRLGEILKQKIEQYKAKNI
jgi:HK97 gp10 family phage protein